MSELEKQILDLQKQLERDELQRLKLQADLDDVRLQLERTHAELKTTQEQLVQQEKLAALGQITAGIANEIKNPLNFVTNFSEMNEELTQDLIKASAAGDSLDEIVEEIRQNCRRINKHGKRAEAVVRSMIQHAAGSGGARVMTDVNALVGEHLALAYRAKQSQIPGLKISIKQDLKKNVGRVDLVPSDIGRVLLNLLNNAIDAVHEHVSVAPPDYTPTVNVATRRIGDHIEISISDNGPGVPAGLREKIFDPFFTTKPSKSGTGLGLPISRDIVVQGHDGTLTLESEDGEGARFIIVLPT